MKKAACKSAKMSALERDEQQRAAAVDFGESEWLESGGQAKAKDSGLDTNTMARTSTLTRSPSNHHTAHTVWAAAPCPTMAAPGRPRRRHRPAFSRSWASMTFLLAAAVSLGTQAAHATTTLARRSSSSSSRRRIAGPGACWLPGFVVGGSRSYSHPHSSSSSRCAVRPRQGQ